MSNKNGRMYGRKWANGGKRNDVPAAGGLTVLPHIIPLCVQIFYKKRIFDKSIAVFRPRHDTSCPYVKVKPVLTILIEH